MPSIKAGQITAHPQLPAAHPQSSELAAYDHVLVDEYRDLNRAEQELIDLFSADGSLAVIGDDDQTSYTGS